MSSVIVGTWGKSLAIRIPLDVAREAGLEEGEKVEIATHNGDLVIHRPEARARQQREAEEAAREIIEESKRHTLGDVSIRNLLDDGRRR